MSSGYDETLPQSTDELRLSQQRSLERTRPPILIPGYDTERFLGAGAYGEVWVGIDRNTRRRVAIKFYTHRGGLDWSLLSREVEKLAFLFADRYVVQLIDVGWDADPPYYIMEYLENGSLADRIREGALPIDEAVVLFREVAIGLTHAHGKGVLHCDLKPGNVLLDQDSRPRLADFGQSRLSHEQRPALGTLFYMAPEQADLQAVPDARWDVYALGALGYCMLTGEPPYRSDTSASLIRSATGLSEQLERYVRLLKESPRPILHRSVPGVDRALSEIIDRCLAIDPARRFPNPQAVVDALAARQIRRSQRPLLILGALGPALLLTLIAGFAWDLSSTAVRESEASLKTRVQESNHFAARFVAETVASQVHRRWDALETAAAWETTRSLTVAATGKPGSAPERRRLERHLADVHDQFPELSVLSWFIVDSEGRRLGRVPAHADTDDANYRYRDYFHGLGRNLEPDDPLIPSVRPIQRPHRSHVIQSTSSGTRVIVFTAPIWDDPLQLETRQVIGVIGLSVELGKFSELGGDESNPAQRIATLVDVRPDSTGRSGCLLEHPFLSQRIRQSGVKLPDVYVDPEPFAVMERVSQLAREPAESSSERHRLSSLDDYRDPVGGEYDGHWLAAIEPVLVDDRLARNRDLGWLVVIQERYADAVRPAQQLGERLTRTGLWAIGIFVAVVTLLWMFVLYVLNELPWRRLSRWISRRAGSSTPSLASGTASPTGGSTRSQRD